MSLPALAVSGTRIVRRDTGEAALLRGVNRSGLEYAEPRDVGFLDAVHLTAEEIGTIVRDWRANIIRLPLNQDWALNGRGRFSSEQYLEAIDNVVGWAAELGAYTLLDLQWLSMDREFGRLEDGSPNRIAPLPDFDSPRFWRTLAVRYRSNPAVLFDVYNEPHDVAAEDWVYWAKLLVRTIREVHPEALCFVSGIDWGYNLRGVPFDEPDVVYSTHVYPWKSMSWERAFGHLAGDVALFGGEWGGLAEDLEWGRRLLAYFDQDAMGWTAWSWCDYPHLVRDGKPTAFGELVRGALTNSGSA